MNFCAENALLGGTCRLSGRGPAPEHFGGFQKTKPGSYVVSLVGVKPSVVYCIPRRRDHGFARKNLKSLDELKPSNPRSDSRDWRVVSDRNLTVDECAQQFSNQRILAHSRKPCRNKCRQRPERSSNLGSHRVRDCVTPLSERNSGENSHSPTFTHHDFCVQ